MFVLHALEAKVDALPRDRPPACGDREPSTAWCATQVAICRPASTFERSRRACEMAELNTGQSAQTFEYPEREISTPETDDEIIENVFAHPPLPCSDSKSVAKNGHRSDALRTSNLTIPRENRMKCWGLSSGTHSGCCTFKVRRVELLRWLRNLTSGRPGKSLI